MQETTLHIVGTDLLDYSFKVEQAIKEGWTFSDKSEYCPRAWPHMFEAFMVRAKSIRDFVNIPQEFVKPSESTLESIKNNPEGVDSNNSNTLNLEASAGVSKQGNRRGAKK